MDRIVAYCGIVCNECPAYIATQANDPAAVARVAAQWREEFNNPIITAEDVPCEGCPGETELKCAHCAECDIRACAEEKRLGTCADCADYPCELLEAFLDSVPQARATLDSLRSGA